MWLVLRQKQSDLAYFVSIEQSKRGELRIPMADRDGMDVPVIDRLDLFSAEKCITRNYDVAHIKAMGSEFAALFRKTNNNLPPVVFADANQTKALARKLKPKAFNLRLCKCKGQKNENREGTVMIW